ncbi:MAG: AsmA-like C-terminal region-containing protein [Chitinispirillales bacterium]|jgi:hypothetical protein|nr:AsmA-like C-terminal region-containing protein [Chitinispirillales bacterium]
MDDHGSRKIEKITTLALFLVSLILLVGFVPIGGAGLFRDAAESVLKGMGADTVSIGSVSVVFWTGLRVKNVDAYKRINDKGDGYRVYAARADVRCNLLGAAAAFAVNRNAFKSGRDVFREAYEKPLELAGDLFGAAASLRPVKKIALRGVGLGFISKGRPDVSVSGAEVTLHRDGERALSGKVFVGEAVIPTLAKIEKLNVRMSVDDKKLELTDGGGSVFGGELRMNVAVDLNRSRILSGEALVSGLDLEKFCAGTGFSPGSLAGKADIEARADSGSPVRLDSLKAKGLATVTNLTVKDLALQKASVVNQLSRDLRLLRFSEVKGGFTIAGGRFNFKEVAGVGDVLKFRSAGWVGFDGKLSQDFEGELSRNFVAGLPKLVRNSLEKTESEGGRFKCKISGTFHKPRIEVDKSVYDRAIGGFFKDLFK